MITVHMRTLRYIRIVRFAAAGLVTAGVLVVAMIATPTPVAQAACSPLPTDKGQVTFTVNVPTTGSYRVWSRVYTPSTSATGFYMQIDQTSCNVLVGHGTGYTANQFRWVDWTGGNQSTKFDVTLSSGTHTVIAAGLDAGLGLDLVLFASDKNCVPTGTSTSCAASNGAVATPVPSPTATPLVIGGGGQTTTPVSGTITLATPSSSGSQKIEYVVDGKKISGNQIDTTKLADGTHTIEVVATDASGNVKKSTQKIQVQNGWQYRLVAGLKQNWQLTLAGVIAVIVLGAGGFLVWRNRLRWRPHAASPDASIDQPAVANSPATSQVFMPDNSDEDRKL